MSIKDYIGWAFVIIAFLAIAFMMIDVYLDERDNERLLYEGFEISNRTQTAQIYEKTGVVIGRPDLTKYKG